MILRKESEIVEEVKVKDIKTENVESEAPAPVAADQDNVVEATDVVDNTPVKKGKEASVRKKSIPLLDQEHRMQVEDQDHSPAIREESEAKVALVQTMTEVAPTASLSSVAPSSISSPAPPPSNPSLQTGEAGRKTSDVSTSSNWSWPSVEGQDRHRENQSPGAGGLNLGLPTSPSRRISTLAPAQVDDPLATQVDKFTMIPHPGK